MKYLLLALLFTPVLNGGNMDIITRAISAGDVATLGKYLDETVEISLEIHQKSLAKHIKVHQKEMIQRIVLEIWQQVLEFFECIFICMLLMGNP